ncbi:hydroxyacylglutathione hydrolase [Rhizobium sp. SG2393]|uniref:hydroxyacylglutathione hydrolase n=1 Tax=Rhizobium sp. SG2393 TaxID=3276279 RepID=UPI003671AAB6
MSAFEIELFLCRSDNFGVILHDQKTGLTVSIDAPEEAAILAALERRGWTLTHILTTHHHADHVEANLALKQRFGATIIGPKNEAAKIPGIDRAVGDGDRFDLSGHTVAVIETPGHTAGHICYHVPDEKLLFAADTLFALGCGRLFERPAPVMWASLQKLLALPDDTVIYFGHEYTMSNARFAITVDPENIELADRVKEITAVREDGRFTAPTTMAVERRTNPFLRPDATGIRDTLGMADATDAEVFAEIRKRKDSF